MYNNNNMYMYMLRAIRPRSLQRVRVASVTETCQKASKMLLWPAEGNALDARPVLQR